MKKEGGKDAVGNKIAYQLTLRWVDYPALSGWWQHTHIGLYMQKRRQKTEMEKDWKDLNQLC